MEKLMTKPTKSFVLTDEIVAFLKERAQEEDRSVSWIARQIFQAQMEQDNGTEDESQVT